MPDKKNNQQGGLDPNLSLYDNLLNAGKDTPALGALPIREDGNLTDEQQQQIQNMPLLPKQKQGIEQFYKAANQTAAAIQSDEVRRKNLAQQKREAAERLAEKEAKADAALSSKFQKRVFSKISAGAAKCY